MRLRDTRRAEWAMQVARRELDTGLADAHSLWDRARAAAVAPGLTRFAVFVACYSALVALCIPLKSSRVEVWPSLAPSDAGQTLETLWQVQAALVSLGFPLLLLLIQFSRDDGVTALRSSEVLARETFVRAAMELATVGLLASGVLAAWLASDAAVGIALFVITLPTATALLRSYFVALNIHFDRTLLRRKSSELLKEKLKSSMRDLWEIQRANAILLQRLEPLGVTRGFIEPEPSDDRWWALTSPRTGQIVDVNVRELEALLAALPIAGTSASRDTSEQAQREPSPASAPKPIQLLRFCGDYVEKGERVIVLLRSQFALTTEPALPLERVLRIETK